MKISSLASRMRVVMSARSRYLPTWMKSQSSPWVMVPSVMPWKRCEAFLTCGEKFVGALALDLFQGLAFHPEVGAVDLLPHFERNLLAHVPGVFARGGDAVDDRVRVLGVEGEEVDDVLAAGHLVVFVEILVVAGAAQDGFPERLLFLGIELGQIEHELEVDVEDAGDVFGPLGITAHPVEGIGDAGEHGFDGITELRKDEINGIYEIKWEEGREILDRINRIG